MLRKTIDTIMDFDSQVLRFAAQSNEEVRQLFDQYFDELARLGIHTPKQGGLFSFERDISPQYREKVNALSRTFQADLYNIVHHGIDTAYGISTSKHTDLLKTSFPEGLNLHAPRRKEAREAFIRHREHPKGHLGLSDRIWNYTNQGRAEVEAAMSLAIEDGIVKGKSAPELGREIRKYLNDPDRMYRRYHRKKLNARGEVVDEIVWKKRVLDDEGHVRFVDAELESVGQGVYRSARANAERCTRSEINGAYRYADYERWQEEEFVIGVKISLSNNHTTLKMVGGKKLRVPFHDICDELQGVYSKDFKWPGWHPQCRCHITPILADKNSRLQWLKEGTPKGYFNDQYITTAPPQMAQWIKENKSRVLRARSLPYWIQDNIRQVRTPMGEERRFDLLGFSMKKPAALLMPKNKLTPLEIAAQRHAKRTTEDIRNIQTRWNKRKNDRTKEELRSLLASVEKNDFTKQIKHDIGQLYVDKRTGLYHAGKVEDIKRRLKIAQAATERHKTRDAAAIQEAWTNSRKKSIAQIAKERHDARTPEYIAKVQRTWNQRRLEREKFFSRYVRIENGKIKDKITDLMNELFKRETEIKPLNEELFNKTRALFRNAEAATQRHKTRNAKAIQSAWDKRKSERSVKASNTKVIPTKAVDNVQVLRVDGSITIEHYDLKKIDTDQGKAIALIKEYRNMVKEQRYLDWLSRVERYVTSYPSQSKKYVRRLSGDVKRFNISEKVDALKSMSKKDLDAIPVFWRERYNELINRINAFDFGNGAHIDIKSTVDEAYNIYKLSTTKECIAFGLENISTKMPYNIFTKLEKAVPGISKRVPGKEFWDLMPEHYPMIVEASSKGSSYCSFTFKFVEIQNAQRLARSQYYQSGLLSHEYGHALDNMLGLNKNSKIRDAFEALKKKYFTQTADTKMLAREYYENNRSGDTLEQLCMLSDLVECFSDGRKTLGFGGHGRAYFESGEKGILEFLAHCSTLQFSGDCEALRTVWKEGYDDIVELFKTFFNL